MPDPGRPATHILKGQPINHERPCIHATNSVLRHQGFVLHEFQSLRRVIWWKHRHQALKPAHPGDYRGGLSLCYKPLIDLQSPWREEIVSIQKNQVLSPGNGRTSIASLTHSAVGRKY